MDANSSSMLPVIQASVTPVILISGAGMLLLTLSNRMGRIVDRTRALARELRDHPGQRNERIEEQLTVLTRRTRLIRSSVMWAVLSMLSACLLIMMIFATTLLKFAEEWLVGAFFFGAIALLFGSLVYFAREMVLSLHALESEVTWSRQGK
ncbi:DUF2721 domain-containing protein [Oleiharenicola sp. Vm1]|uniref:DUF2721 domain-containing protein n=1 Tax=Oleiharenicola sp. Vm1 TaxID=3398393 RepID=UPI0039F4EC8D